jgi:hypothetical protein
MWLFGAFEERRAWAHARWALQFKRACDRGAHARARARSPSPPQAASEPPRARWRVDRAAARSQLRRTAARTRAVEPLVRDRSRMRAAAAPRRGRAWARRSPQSRASRRAASRLRVRAGVRVGVRAASCACITTCHYVCARHAAAPHSSTHGRARGSCAASRRVATSTTARRARPGRSAAVRLNVCALRAAA